MTTEERLENLDRDLACAKRRNRWLVVGLVPCMGALVAVWALSRETQVGRETPGRDALSGTEQGGGDSAADNEPVLALWDPGDAFVQRQQTLILAIWSDGKVVSRVDKSGNVQLVFKSLLDIPKTPVMLGRIEKREVERLLTAITQAEFFEVSEYAGMITVDGPGVDLHVRVKDKQRVLRHVGIDDEEFHARLKALTGPTRKEAERFAQMWDKVIRSIRDVHPTGLRALTPENNITTVIPWGTRP